MELNPEHLAPINPTAPYTIMIAVYSPGVVR